MLKVGFGVGLGLSALLLGCGAEQKQPEFPPPPEPTSEEAPDPSWDTGDAPAAEKEPEPEAPKEAPAPKEPEFKDGMSVNEAISAVPSHYEYIGIEQEVLAKPLTNLDTYKECKVSQNDHFSVRVAVWEGRVVGADVTAPPAKKACIERVVRSIEYKEKVKSINTVEFSF